MKAHANSTIKAPAYQPFSQLSIRVIFKNHFAAEYLRNNKQHHNKNLLCFPSCRCDPATGLQCHNKFGFCGTSVLVEAIFSSTDRNFDIINYLENAIFIGEIQDKHIEKGKEFWVDDFEDYVGGGLSKDNIIAQLKDRSNSKESISNNRSLSAKAVAPPMYHKGKIVSAPIRNINDEWTVGVEFNSLPKSWQYLWASSKHVASVSHAFTVSLFTPTRRSSQDMQITGIFRGPLFQVGSKRRANKELISYDESTESSQKISINNIANLQIFYNPSGKADPSSYRDQQEIFETSTTITSIDSDSEDEENEIKPTKLSFRDDFIKTCFSDISIVEKCPRKNSNLSDGDTSHSSTEYAECFEILGCDSDYEPRPTTCNSIENPMFYYPVNSHTTTTNGMNGSVTNTSNQVYRQAYTPSSTGQYLSQPHIPSAHAIPYQTSSTDIFPLPANNSNYSNYNSGQGSNADNLCSPNWHIFNMKNGISPGIDDVIDALDSIFSPGFISDMEEAQKSGQRSRSLSMQSSSATEDNYMSSHRVSSINEVIKRKRSIEESCEKLRFDDIVVSDISNISHERPQFTLLCATDYVEQPPASSKSKTKAKSETKKSPAKNGGKLSPVFNCSSGDMSYIDQEAVSLMMQFETKSNFDSKRQKTIGSQ